MSKPEFVHLHNHSEYSLLDGVIRISDKSGGPSETLKTLAAEGAKGFAVTDHGNMFGAVEFYQHANKVGLKPIVGCEMYFSKGKLTDRGHSQKENCHLTVLAKNYEGYQNLMALVSKGFTEGYYYDPRVDKDLLSKHSRGLVILSGCLKSELSQLILSGNLVEAEKLACWFRDTLDPESFYLEIMDHNLDKQRQVLKALLELHERTRIPLIATNDCHYSHPADWEAHDARVCISTGRKLEDVDRLKFETHEFYVKSPEQMHQIFSFKPDALANTLKVAEMCHLKIPMDSLLLPEFTVPEGFSQDSYLEDLCLKGLKERIGEIRPEYRERLNYELGVIKKMGFSGYFLIVWDFINESRRMGVPVGPGRGSGAGALVAYCLRITNVDPLKHNLLFERFLNPDRKSMPDLDIDFADTGRDKVIDYVRHKYGETNVAQIITFGSMAAKLVVRDVGRVMNMPLSEVDKIAKMIPAGPNVTLNDSMQKVPELAEAAKSPQIKRLLDLSMKLEGLKRHTGVHAAGTLITKEPVVKYTPLAKGTKSDVVTTQYDGDICPKLGLLKVDFLGLRTLSIIDDAIKFIRARKDPKFDIDAIPMDDAKTFDLLRSAKALAVFQLDSQGMRDLLFRIKPSEFHDIVSLIALFRPGPMQSGMLDQFVERKHGREKVVYEHPLMEPILKETYGCMVFQEQIMEISKKLAGFTPGEADGLRKAMGKKHPEDLEKMRGKFVEGCAKNKIKDKLANKIYDQMVKFGGYGFNKSHSAAYGVVAYQTAYLKANYPLEFMTAVATSEIGHSAIGNDDKENKLVTYLEEARHMGLKILPPDIQKSEAKFSIEDPDNIRFGLVAIKNVGQGAVDSILQARAERPFKDLDDFCARVDLHAANKKVLESLVKAGAMDGLDAGANPEAKRGRLLAGLDSAVDRQARIREDLSRGQGLLFGADVATVEPPRTSQGSGPSLSEHDVLKFEKEVLGFYFSGHPLLGVKDQLKGVATHEIAALNAEITAPVRVAGLITQVKRAVTKSKGEQWASANLEDLSGEIRLLVFPRAYASGLGQQLKVGAIVTAAGRLSVRGEGAESAPELIVDEIQPLELAMLRFGRKLRIFAHAEALEESVLERLRSALEEHPGRCPVVMEHETPEGRAVLELEHKVRLDQNLLDSIVTILGEKSWRIESAS